MASRPLFFSSVDAYLSVKVFDAAQGGRGVGGVVDGYAALAVLLAVNWPVFAVADEEL